MTWLRSLLVCMAAVSGTCARAAPVEAAAEPRILAGAIAPYVFEDGHQSRGVLAELVAELARRAGRRGTIDFLPWARAQEMTVKPRDGKPCLILPLTLTAERKERFAWIVPLLADEALLVTRKGTPKVEKVADAKGRRVGALMGSPLEAELRTLGFAKVDAGVDEETNARKLSGGRLDVWLVASMVAPFVYGRIGLDPSTLVYGARVRTNELWLAATLGFPKAEADLWVAALAAAKADGTYDRIVKHDLQASDH